MKNKMLHTLLLVLIVVPGFAKQYTYTYGKYRIGQTVYLWGDNVNIRSAPSVSGKVVDRLRIGSALTIKQVLKQTHTIRGYREFWYRVSYVAGTGGKDLREGCVWGGMLAKAAVSFMDRESVHRQYLLVGAFGRGAFKKITEARLVRSKRMVARMRFKPIFKNTEKGLDFGVCINGRKLSGKGFPEYLKIFAVDFVYGAFGFPNGSVFIAWDGKRLYNSFRLLYTGNMEGGVYFEVYLPGQNGVPADTVRVLYTRYKIIKDDDQDRIQRIGKKLVVNYRWNGRGFTKTGKRP